MNNTLVLEEAVKASIYEGSLVLVWIVTLLSIFGVTALFKSKKTDWGRFWQVWFFTALISGIFVMFISVSPNVISNFFDSIKGIFLS